MSPYDPNKEHRKCEKCDDLLHNNIVGNIYVTCLRKENQTIYGGTLKEFEVGLPRQNESSS